MLTVGTYVYRPQLKLQQSDRMDFCSKNLFLIYDINVSLFINKEAAVFFQEIILLEQKTLRYFEVKFIVVFKCLSAYGSNVRRDRGRYYFFPGTDCC